MSRFHLDFVMYEMGKQRVLENNFKCPNLKAPLETLVKVYALKLLTDDSQYLFETGFFSQGSSLLRDQAYKHLLVTLRPHMLGLVEFSPNLSSGQLSTIGNEYGDIYEQQLEVAKGSRLNKTEVPSYYETLIKPTMTMRKAKL